MDFFLLLLLVSVTKFIKSLGLLVDVCICCSPLDYNKRRSWREKKKIFIYLAILGMFVEKWWAIRTKLPSLGEHWVSSWVWIQQQPVTVACWLSLSIAHGNLSPFLPWSGDTRGFWGADCCFFWSESRSTMLLPTGDPFFCTSWLRILSGRDAPRLVWQGLALFSRAAPGLSTGLAALSLHQGYSTVELAFFVGAEMSKGVSASLNALQLCAHKFDSSALHQCLWNFSSFIEMQRRVQSNLLHSKRLG